MNTALEPGVDVPLLRKVVEWAEVEAQKPFMERRWYQDAYYMKDGDTIYNPERDDFDVVRCGTAFCIAGWTVAETLGAGEAMNSGGDVVDSKTGRFIRDCEDRAREMLNISSDHGLFDCGLTIEEVRRIAEKIAGESL
jgi:hypothetical protein